MSFFELILLTYTITAFVCALIVACMWTWFYYCSWVIRRDRDRFWQHLEQQLSLQTQRYVASEGPYR